MSFNSETTRIVQVLTTTNQAVSLNGFYFQTDDQVSVVSMDADGVVTARSITTDYTLTGAGLSTYGTLTVVGGTVGDTWFVYRDVPITQLIGWVQQGGFSMRNLTIATDKAAMIDLQLQEQIDRAAKFPRTESSSVSAELPTLDQRKGNAAAWNSVTGEWEAIARSEVAASDAGSITYTSAAGDAGKDLEAKIQGLAVDVVADKGADPTGATDSSAEIQAAIDTGLPVFIPDGTYLASGLTVSTDYQSFLFSGNAILKKNANGPLMTVSANRTQFYRARFDGDGSTYTGHNLVKTGAHMILMGCSSRDSEGRAVLDSDGNGLRIVSTNDIYQTADATASGYDIEIAGSGIYGEISGIYTSQSTGGILINQTGSGGTHRIIGGQFGKLAWTGGSSGGNRVFGCRINGDVSIEKGDVSIDLSSTSADVTLGDGSTAYSQLNLGAAFSMSGGTTLSITNGIQDSSFNCLATLRNNGVTITNTASADNSFFDSRVSYTPTWVDSGGGTPDIDNGSLIGSYSRQGRRVSLDIFFQWGSGTTGGSGGAWTFSLPIANTALFPSVGTALLKDASGNFYSAVCEVAASGSTISIRIDGAGTVTNTAPFSWASGDYFKVAMEYEA